MNMQWIEAMQEMRANNKAKCPNCGGAHVKYSENTFDSTGIGYADIWCEDCMHAMHISRGHFTNPINPGIDIPNNLIYE